MIRRRFSAERLHRLQMSALVADQFRIKREFRHPEDPVHRRPDLMTHVGEEFALRSGGSFRFQLGGRQAPPHSASDPLQHVPGRWLHPTLAAAATRMEISPSVQTFLEWKSSNSATPQK